MKRIGCSRQTGLGVHDDRNTQSACQSYKNKTALQELVSASEHELEIIQSPKNMAELISWADLAISAAGSTCWEMAFLGLPAILVIAAKNQEAVAIRMQEHGAAINLGWYNFLDKDKINNTLTSLLHNDKQRLEMSKTGNQLIDGKGCKRIISEMKLYTNNGEENTI